MRGFTLNWFIKLYKTGFGTIHFSETVDKFLLDKMTFAAQFARAFTAL